MTEWDLEVEFIPPEMSGLPGKKRITGSIEQINKIMDAVMKGKIKLSIPTKAAASTAITAQAQFHAHLITWLHTTEIARIGGLRS